MFDAVFTAKPILGAAALVVALIPSASLAQDLPTKMGIEAGVSTLGVYIGPTYKMNDTLTARLPVYIGSTSFSDTYEGNDASVNFNANSAALMADYHPSKNGFRISGGIGLGGYEATTSITDPELDGTVFVGSADFTLEQKNRIVPVVSVGYSKTFDNGFGVLAELGAKIGTYTVTSSNSFLPAGQQADYDAEIAKINDDLAADIKATPFLTFGISYKY